MKRRDFLRSSAAAALAGSTVTNRVLGANDRFRVGVMGLGGRGRHLSRVLAARNDVEITHLCDVDSRVLDKALEVVGEHQSRAPQTISDFRRILDDKSVDVLVNATPDHWHSLGTILACQAGKDVYVEKPASHSLWEGRKAVEAARKYRRVVQLGSQNRSAPYVRKAVAHIQAGGLGDVHMVRVINMKQMTSIGHTVDETPPQELDYDTWLGPASRRPFNANRFDHWNWFWDYSGGDIINDGVHQMDIARWLIGRDHPGSVTTAGGSFHFKDDQEAPDTLHVLFGYEGLTMTFELAMWTPYMKKTPWDMRQRDQFPNWMFSSTRIELYGTKGLMMMSRHGGGWQAFGSDWKETAAEPGRRPLDRHLDNFFECIRSRGRPNADIEEGHLSTSLCHLANISHRLGGRKLRFDGRAERFAEDPEANHLLKRTYRKPWVIPEEV